jgi:hypothetical protein
MGPLLAIPLLGALWAGVWWVAADRLPPAVRRGVTSTCAVGLLVFAAARAAGPLAYLDYQSPLQQIRDDIDRSLAAGEPLHYPIPLGRPSVQIARFLFGEDFEIVTRFAADGGTELVLHRKGNPRVLDRSLGRTGLEWRFEQARKQEEQREPERASEDAPQPP